MNSGPFSLTGHDCSRVILSREDAMSGWVAVALRWPGPVRTRSGLATALLAGAVVFANEPAAADFRLCNNTTSRVGIAIGYKENDGWATEGWWNLNARSCETLLRGPLVARFYYIYAVDYDRGGEWSGQAFMCTRDKEFTIKA